MIDTTPHHTDTTTQRVDRREPIAPVTLSARTYTRVDVVVVGMILVLLSMVVFFAVDGLRADASEPGCAGDRQALAEAVDVYIIRNGSAAIPATGTDNDRYEHTLVDLGLIPAVSHLYDLDATGAVTPEGDTPCSSF